jgi:hypothetical protein
MDPNNVIPREFLLTFGERLDALVFDSSQPRANGVLTQPAQPGLITSNHPQDRLDPPTPASR